MKRRQFLAALGTGAVPSFDSIHTWAQTAGVNQPNPAACRRYHEIYPVYAGLYAKLKPDFDRLGREEA